MKRLAGKGRELDPPLAANRYFHNAPATDFQLGKGISPADEGLSPERARQPSISVMPPLQGLFCLVVGPRAASWAGLSRPFGANTPASASRFPPRSGM
jgi:hypothetical protein